MQSIFMKPLFIELTDRHSGEKRAVNINLMTGFGEGFVNVVDHIMFVTESYETIKNTIIEMKKVF